MGVANYLLLSAATINQTAEIINLTKNMASPLVE